MVTTMDIRFIFGEQDDEDHALMRALSPFGCPGHTTPDFSTIYIHIANVGKLAVSDLKRFGEKNLFGH